MGTVARMEKHYQVPTYLHFVIYSALGLLTKHCNLVNKKKKNVSLSIVGIIDVKIKNTTVDKPCCIYDNVIR